MFQDFQSSSRSGGRSRQLSVPERRLSGVRPRGVRPPSYLYTVERRVISDMVVSPQGDHLTVTEESTTDVYIDEPVQKGVVQPVAAVEPVSPKPNQEMEEPNVQPKKIKVEPKAGVRPTRKPKKKWFSSKVRSIASGILLVTLLGVTGYISVDTYLTNQELKRRLDALPAVAVGETATPEQRQQAEGMDEEEPSEAAVVEYKVAADMPRYIKIGKIGVNGRVLQMGVNPDGSMQAPINIYDAGWYNGSSKPGTDGAAVIDAHASGPSREGLFAYVNTLEAGDTVSVEMGDGTELAYRVVRRETVARDKVDMQKVMEVYGDAAQGLNLITCDGEWVKDGSTFSDRTIVYTERV